MSAPICETCGEPYIGGSLIGWMHPFCLGGVHKAEKEILRLIGALLDIETIALTGESARDIVEDVVARVESVLGKAPRPYAAKSPGEPAVRTP